MCAETIEGLGIRFLGGLRRCLSGGGRALWKADVAPE